MTSCEVAKYFDKFKLVPRELGTCDKSVQRGGQLDDSAQTEHLNRLKLLKLQENGDLSRLQQTSDDMELFRKTNLGPEGISALMERAENRNRALARKKAEGAEDAAEPINETLDGRMSRLEAYLHRMIQATEGVSRNIIQQSNVLPTLSSTMERQTYAKHSPIRVSSPYKVDRSRSGPKVVAKPYAINPAERVKTKHRKVKKGPDFMYGKGFNHLINKERLLHNFTLPDNWETVQ